jgi:hypothetical protein
MAGTNVESARQKSAGDEMVSAEFLPKQDRRELNSAATIRWLSSAVLSSAESQDHKAPEDFT